MAADASGTGISWAQLPDYVRVAAVLGALLVAVGLGGLLRWVRLARAGAARRPGSGTGGMGRRMTTDRSTEAPGMPASAAGGGDGAPPTPPEHEELPLHEANPVLRGMHWVMRLATYVLAIAMVIVILEGVVSVLHTLYLSMSQPPFFMVPDIVKTFGAFLAVLIAYEIFANITLYIRSDVFPVKLVVATAVMAVARKVIVLDMDEYSALDLMGIGAVMLGLGITYWLIAIADEQCGPARSSLMGRSDRGHR